METLKKIQLRRGKDKCPSKYSKHTRHFRDDKKSISVEQAQQLEY